MTRKKVYNLKDLYKSAESVWNLKISDDDLKKELFSYIIWMISTRSGKHDERLPYSKNAWKHKKAKDKNKILRHHHFPSRLKLKEEWINEKSKEKRMKIYKKIRACVLTKEEHDQLHKKEKKLADFEVKRRWKNKIKLKNEQN